MSMLFTTMSIMIVVCKRVHKSSTGKQQTVLLNKRNDYSRLPKKYVMRDRAKDVIPCPHGDTRLCTVKRKKQDFMKTYRRDQLAHNLPVCRQLPV